MVWKRFAWFGLFLYILKTPYFFGELRLLFVKSIYDKETLFGLGTLYIVWDLYGVGTACMVKE